MTGEQLKPARAWLARSALYLCVARSDVALLMLDLVCSRLLQISGIDRIDPFLKSEPWFVKLAEDLRPNITTDRNHCELLSVCLVSLASPLLSHKLFSLAVLAAAIYLHRLLTVAHKFWAQSSRLSLSHVLSPREAAAFLSNFCRCMFWIRDEGRAFWTSADSMSCMPLQLHLRVSRHRSEPAAVAAPR